MSSTPIVICGQEFDPEINHFSFKKIDPPTELEKLKFFPNLRSVSLDSTNLDDLGLDYLCQCPTIDNLNLQDTEISDQGLASLARLHGLKYLRLKENSQLTNACIPHLNRLKNLQELSINETKIDQDGLKKLALPNLRYLVLNVWKENYSLEGLKQISRQLPQCEIVAKGKGSFEGGYFTGNWKG